MYHNVVIFFCFLSTSLSYFVIIALGLVRMFIEVRTSCCFQRNKLVLVRQLKKSKHIISNCETARKFFPSELKGFFPYEIAPFQKT